MVTQWKTVFPHTKKKKKKKRLFLLPIILLGNLSKPFWDKNMYSYWNKTCKQSIRSSNYLFSVITQELVRYVFTQTENNHVDYRFQCCASRFEHAYCQSRQNLSQSMCKLFFDIFFCSFSPLLIKQVQNRGLSKHFTISNSVHTYFQKVSS
jgi:hypothetical protein